MSTMDSHLKDLRSHIQGSSSVLVASSGSAHRSSLVAEGYSGHTDLSLVLQSMIIKVPKFDGSDPNGWVFRIEEFFDFHETPEHLRLCIIAFHMEGRAAAWYQWVKANKLITTWKDFLISLKHQFGASMYDDPQDVFTLAKANEARLEEAKMSGRPWTKWPPPSAPTMTISSISKIPPPSHVPVPTPTTNSSPVVPTTHQPPKQTNLLALLPTPNLPVRRLTPAELRDKREKGLCYNCDQKYSANHHYRSKFFILMGTDDDENEDTMKLAMAEPFKEMVTTDISSLNALAGQVNPHSLRLIGKVGNHCFQVLINSGSTHNFIKHVLAERLGLPIQPTTHFRVYIGNGDFLVCQLYCPQVALTMQDYAFTLDLFVLPIEGSDVILGIQWLQRLERVSHDYAAMTMNFYWDGKLVSLCGDVTNSPSLITFNQFQALMHSTTVPNLFELQYIHSQQDGGSEDLELPVSLPTLISHLLYKFHNLFRPPTGLPLHSTITFEALKQGMVEVPVLRLPNFELDFIIETDASNVGIGVALMQDNHPISYFSKKLGPKLQVASTYIKELHAIAEVYIRKLIGYHFKIEYKPSRANQVVDVLSRVHEDEPVEAPERYFAYLLLVSSPTFDLLETLRLENTTCPDLVLLHKRFATGELSPDFSVYDGLLFFRHRYYTDGQSEVVNRRLEQYLLAFTQEKPQSLVSLLYWAEFSYNSSYHSGLKMTPFQALYGHNPPTILAYSKGSTSIQALNDALTERDALLRFLKENLCQAQHRMTQKANAHRRELQLNKGDHVLVRLQPYRKTSLAQRASLKLAKRYYGPFTVLEHVRPMAYKLNLPLDCKIHYVFHISMLKPFSVPALSIGYPYLVIASTIDHSYTQLLFVPHG
ncbi:hypothetical protein KPL70_011188 [Citrus sinensis]|nr:hypothetical protein KPL70_011188 [Citrus sinensis]